MQENWWAIGTTIGGEQLQPWQSTGINQTAINNTFEGILEHNKTYYVSIICENGAGQQSGYNESHGRFPFVLYFLFKDVRICLGAIPLK